MPAKSDNNFNPVARREEVQVFRDFVKQAGLPVAIESIERRKPPEPDILCRFADGSHVAFELVEICHRENAIRLGSVSMIGGIVEEVYSRLPGELRHRLDFLFADRALSFTFRADATINRIRVLLPRVFTELLDQPVGNEGQFIAFSPVTQKILESVFLGWSRVHEPDRPHFTVTCPYDMGDAPVAETIQRKLKKEYETPHPIELLAYFGILASDRSVSWTSHLLRLIQSGGLGTFRRVWICGRHRVHFVYPE